MQCTNPFTLVDQYNMIVPCGKCLACRIKKRQEWAMRMMHERESWQDSLFLTLTYSDFYLPFGRVGLPTLRKDHLQKFFKRLRHHLRVMYYVYNSCRRKPNKRYMQYPIRYFACGEYGDNTQRPHYHAIMFGLSQFNVDREVIKHCWPYCDWNNSYIERKSFGSAEADSMRYVSQYIDKKYDNDYSDEVYSDLGREPVFKLASNGIGRDWCIIHESQIADNMSLTFNGKTVSLPRYYINLLGLDISDLKKAAAERNEEVMASIIGLDMSLEEVYRFFSTDDVKYIDSVMRDRSRQRDKTLAASVNLARSKKM